MFLVLSALALYLRSGHAQEIVYERLNSTFPGHISWTDGRLFPLRGNAVFNDVLLSGTDGGEVAHIERLSLGISWLSLARRSLTFTHVKMSGLRVTLVPDDAGRLTLLGSVLPVRVKEPPQGGKKRGVKAPFKVVFRNIEVADSSARYSNKSGTSVSAADIRINAGGDVSGRSGSIVLVTGRISVHGPRSRAELMSLNTEAALLGDRLELPSFEASTGTSVLNITGSARNLYSNPLVDLAAAFNVSLSEIMDVFPIDPVLTGGIEGEASFRGFLGNPDVAVSLAYRNGVLFGQRIEGADLRCVVIDRKAEISDLRVSAADGEASLKGEIDFRSVFAGGYFSPKRNFDAVVYSTELHAGGMRIERLFPGVDGMPGTVSTSISVSGNGITLPNASAKGTLDFSISRLMAGALGHPSNLSLGSGIALERGEMTLKECRLNAGMVSLLINGAWNIISGPVSAEVTLDLKDADGERSPEVNGLQEYDFTGDNLWTGKIDGTIHPAGGISRLYADLYLHGSSGAIGNVRSGEVEAEVHYADGKLDLERVHVRSGRSDLVLSGSASILQPGTYSVLEDPLFDIEVTGFPVYLEDFTRRYTGKMIVRAHIGGKKSAPAGFVSVRGENIDLGPQSFQEIALGAVVKPDQIVIENIELTVAPGEMILGSGWYSFDKRYGFSLVSNGISVENIHAVAVSDEVQGDILLDVSGNGSQNSLEISGDAVLRRPLLFGRRLGDFNVRIDIGENTGPLAGSGSVEPAGGGRVRVFGNGKKDGKLDINVSGIVPFYMVALFLEEAVDAEGSIIVSTSISGGMLKPEVHAEFQLHDLGMTIPGIFQKLHGVNGKLRILPGELMIEAVNGTLDTGKVHLAGKIDLDGLRPSFVSITLDGTAIPLHVPDTLDMLLNAELLVLGSPGSSEIKGRVFVLEGTYYRDMRLSYIQHLSRRRREHLPFIPDLSLPFLRNSDLDISMVGRSPIIVDNNLAFLTVDPDLHVGGTLSNLVISGRAEIESGTVTYMNRAFTVRRGVVDFLNPHKIEPEFDIVSDGSVRNWAIVLTISGTPDDLLFQLDSEPPEEEEDILSLLLIGRTPRELIEEEGGASQSAAQILAQLLTLALGDDIKRRTGLDVFETETQVPGDEESLDRIKVTLGKDITERIAVKYSVESVSSKMIQQATAEYKFLQNIILRGYQNNLGVSGGAVQYRLEFR